MFAEYNTKLKPFAFSLFFSYDNSKLVVFCSVLSDFANLCNQAKSERILNRSVPELAIESNIFDARLSLMIGSGYAFVFR